MNSRQRVPEMEDVKVTRMINGPEAFTPDNEFCLGETEILGLFVAAGFCAHGLAGAGGIGKVLAEWIAEGEPSLDLWHMDIRRFGAQYRSPSYTLKRIRETYETYYDIRYPAHERQAGRPLRMSPANAWHREHDAAFGEKSGWERVNWYGRTPPAATAGCARAAGPVSTGRPRSGPSTRPAARPRRSSTSPRSRRSRSPGPARPSLLELLCDNEVAREVGQDHLHADAQHAWRDRVRLHRRPARRGALLDRHRHRLRQPRSEWIRRHLPGDGSVQVHDVTSAWACFGIWGPRARDVLEPLTPQSLANDDFPYLTLREITVGDVPVRALRVTFVGELGCELYCPTEYGLALVAQPSGGGRTAWHGRRGVSRDRLAATREGLSRLGRRHHA